MQLYNNLSNNGRAELIKNNPEFGEKCKKAIDETDFKYDEIKNLFF